MADIPRNSHFRFDYAVSIKFAEGADFWGMEWGDFNFMTYIMTAGPAGRDRPWPRKLNRLAVDHKCPQVVDKQLDFSVQRLEDIYLNPLGPYDIPLGNKRRCPSFLADRPVHFAHRRHQLHQPGHRPGGKTGQRGRPAQGRRRRPEAAHRPVLRRIEPGDPAGAPPGRRPGEDRPCPTSTP